MFKHYLLTALRHFARHKVTTGINLTCLALGLVCFLLAWGAVVTLGTMDVHHSRAARTYFMTYLNSTAQMTVNYTPWQMAESLKADFPQLESVARLRPGQELTINVAGRNSSITAGFADADFLRIFDLPFAAGDARTALDRPRSAVLSAALAKRLFGTEQVVGRSLRLAGSADSVTITGILTSIPQPSHLNTANSYAGAYFEALLSMDVHLAMLGAGDAELARLVLQRWNTNFYITYLVVPDHAPLSAATLNAQMDAFAARHVSGDLKGTRRYRVRPIADFMQVSLDMLVGAQKTGVSSITIVKLLGMLVLLVACVNYANLANAQAAGRQKEVALRTVIGASRRQLIVQYLLESALLTTVALALAIALIGLAGFSTPSMSSLVLTLLSMPRVWIALALLLATVSVCAGAYPAFSMVFVRPVHGLGKTRVKSSSRWLTTVLVGLQFFSASFLIISVLVMLMQNEALKRAMWNPESDPILIIENDAKRAHVDPAVLRAQLLRTQGVTAVTAIQRMPWSLGGAGDRLAASSDSPRQIGATQNIVGIDFFRTLNIGLIAGRDFDREHADDIANVAAWWRSDATSASDFNAIIDRSLAQRLGFSNPQAAVGHTIYRPTSQTGQSPPQRLRIIGVVENVVLRPISAGAANFYLFSPEAAVIPLVRIARTTVSDALAGIDRVWHGLAAEQPLKRRFASEQIEQAFQWIEVISTIFAILAALASAIALMSLFGTALHATRARTHEIGVRKTLGGSVSQILIMLLAAFSKPVLCANVAAWPLAYFVMRSYMSLFAYSSGSSVGPFVASLFITLFIAGATVFAQSIAAARVRPATVLRYE